MIIIFSYLMKLYKALFMKKKEGANNNSGQEQEKKPEKPIPASINECKKAVKEQFNNSSDMIIMPFETKMEEVMVVYVDGMSNKDLIDRDIVTPLKSPDFDGDVELWINVSQFKTVENLDDFANEILDGNTAIFYGKSRKAVIVDLKSWDSRSVAEPDAEAVIRGPKEGFVETIRINTSLLRRKIKTPGLVFENLVIGKQTKTRIALAYIQGIVNKDVLKELKTRLSKIDCDAILESGYIEQYIEDKPLSPIATVGITQKPDKLAGMILEGRIGIFCDGTPHALYVPHLFIENIQSSEDYYNRSIIATIIRVIRLFALFISIILPGFYVAMVTYNQEMIPDVFLITLASAREKIPFPAGAEMFFMIIMFELLRESGTRLPRAVGSAISIVGALIIGDAAVSAGIVGAPAVIILALTAVSSFIISSLTEFMTVYRFVFLILGGVMGLIGISAGIVIMFIQIASVNSFGIPILSHFSKEEMKDMITRMPFKDMKYRPQTIVGDNKKRNNTP